MSTSRNALMDKFGNIMVALFHRIALFGIGAATIWAAGVTFVSIFMQSHASIGDLLW